MCATDAYSPRTKFGIVSLPLSRGSYSFSTPWESPTHLWRRFPLRTALSYITSGYRVVSCLGAWKLLYERHVCKFSPPQSAWAIEKLSLLCSEPSAIFCWNIDQSDFPDHCQKSSVMTNHDKGKTFLSAANRRRTEPDNVSTSTSKKQLSITFWIVFLVSRDSESGKKKWIVKIYVG